jgi:hypothetical protein
MKLVCRAWFFLRRGLKSDKTDELRINSEVNKYLRNLHIVEFEQSRFWANDESCKVEVENS